MAARSIHPAAPLAVPHARHRRRSRPHFPRGLRRIVIGYRHFIQRTFSISPTTISIDTNCTGCNATNNSGTAIEQFSATLTGGGAANVTWAVTGGDASTGAGIFRRAANTLRRLI
ncbi:MAG: hypothetical protein WDM87_11800 [Terracidiphilus sp.]